MAGRHSRNKGANEERAVVNFHRQHGIPAKRTLEAGKRSDGSETYDIDVYWKGEDNAALVGETKVRGSGFTQLYKWKGTNDFLTVRTDSRERLYIISEDLWLKLIARQP